jgi:peptidylglycine monooxygenase
MSLLDANNMARYVTLGGERYLVDRDWIEWSEASPKGFVSQVAVDSHGNLFLVNRGNPVIQVFDPDGKLVRQLSSDVLSHGHGIFIATDDSVFIVDSDRHCVHKFDSDLQHVLTIGRQDYPTYGEPFNHPTDVGVSADGHIFVSDGYGNSHIHKFAPSGEHLKTWGGSGDEDGQFSNPHSIWVTHDNSILVADRENNRVERFSPDGARLGTFCRAHHPTEICQAASGIVYVTDLTPRISAYSAEGELLGRCRTFGAIGHGVCTDHRGDIYIADMMPNTITRFRKIS